MRRKTLVAVFAATTFCIGTMTACSGGAATADGGDDAFTVAYVPTTMNNPFWGAVLDGLKEELGPEGVKIVTVDAANDQSKMNDQVGDLIAQGVDVLVLAPFDSTAVRPALKQAAEAGIPVVNVDTPVVDTDLVATVVASDNENAGAIVAQDMMGRLPEGSKIGIMDCPAGGACILRLKGFKAEADGYFDIVQSLDGRGDTNAALPLATDMLTANPDLAAVFALNDPMALGVAQAVKEAGKEDSVLIYGVDGSPDAKVAIENDSLTGTGAQSPLNMGRKAALAAIDILAGKKVESNIVIDTFIITNDNVAEFGTDAWQ